MRRVTRTNGPDTTVRYQLGGFVRLRSPSDKMAL
jgi:hypothetical protein